MNEEKISKLIKENKIFFDNSVFFDNKTKQKVEKNSNLNFDNLINWCCIQCHKRPTKVDYIGNQEYVKFFLFCIYRHKNILEKLWIKTKKIHDKGFKLRLIDNLEQFKQYLWELYLKYYFIIKGMNIKKSSKNCGPDIYIESNSTNIYLECIVPNQGNNEYRVPEIVENGIGQIPIAEIKRRFKYAINEKINKYKIYIANGMVDTNDKLLIALNTSGLSYYGSLMDFTEPLLLECCKELNVFEDNSFLDGILYNHKTIFEYSNDFKIILIKKDYSLIEDEIKI